MKVFTDEDTVAAAYAFLAYYQCTAPGEAGMTTAEVARDLGYSCAPVAWTPRSPIPDPANRHWIWRRRRRGGQRRLTVRLAPSLPKVGSGSRADACMELAGGAFLRRAAGTAAAPATVAVKPGRGRVADPTSS